MQRSHLESDLKLAKELGLDVQHFTPQDKRKLEMEKLVRRIKRADDRKPSHN